MMLLSIYVLLIVLNFKFPSSKKIFVVDFLFMWILMGWNHSVADYVVYYRRYTNPEIYGTLEPLYVYFQNLGKMFNLDYDSFQIVMAFVFLLIRMIAVQMLSKKPNIVIGLYLLFPFIMDITQLKMFYATSLILLGIAFLLKGKKVSNIVFVVFVLVATMIHSACICYLFLLIPINITHFSTKTYLRICVISCLALFALLFSGALYQIVCTLSSLFGFGTKFVETVFSASQAYEITHKIVYMLEICIFFYMMNLILKKAHSRYKLKENNKLRSVVSSNNEEIIDICYKVNYTLVIILPLAWLIGDIYRVQHGILILFYSAFSDMEFFRSRKIGKVTIYQVYTGGFVALFIVLFLVGNSSLRESVFLPVFFDNVLFR